MSNKKLVIWMLGSVLLLGVGAESVSAYENYGLFHVYTQQNIDEIKTEFEERVSECRLLIGKLENKNDADDLSVKIEKLEAQSNQDFYFNMKKYSNFKSLINRTAFIKKTTEKKLEQEELARKEKLKQEKLAEDFYKKHAEDVWNSQDEQFENVKRDFIKKVDNKVKEISLCMEGIPDCGTFDPIVNSLKKSAEQIKSNIQEMELNEKARDFNVEKFNKNLENEFSNIKNQVNEFTDKAQVLVSDTVKIKKSLEQQAVAEAKEEFYSLLLNFDKQIEDFFGIQNVDEKDEITVQGLKSDLKESLEDLKSIVENMSSLNDKMIAEKEIKLFSSKYNRFLERKKIIVDRYMALKQKEQNLEDIHDFEKQIEMLRGNKLSLNDVVGGYENVVSKMDQLINQHKKRAEIGKGTPSKGMILYGKPGTGKTCLVKAIAASHNFDLVMLKRRTDSSDMEAEIKAKFNEAKTLSEGGKRIVILLADEIDALGSIRIPGKTDKETVAFMTEIDSLKPSDGILVIATTNLLSSVDEAVKRSGRLEEICEVARPTEQDIKEILKICISGYKLEEGEDVNTFVDSFVSEFRGKTGADIKRTIERAIQNNIQENDMKFFRDITLKKDDISKAIRNL